MARKIKVKTDNSGWKEDLKNVNVRKPMTEEQRQAAAERLEKARKKTRAAKNPNYGQSSIHESLRDLPDDAPINPQKVKKWIKTQKELASAVERRNEKSGVKGDPLTEDHLMRHMFVICKNIYEMVIGLIYSMVSTKKKDQTHMQRTSILLGWT